MSISEIKKERLAESICRLCFAESEHYQLIFIDDCSSFKEWIEKLTTLKIMKVPNAPASLCSDCENTLQSFESFREMCFSNDRVFNDMFTQIDDENDYNAVSSIPEVSEINIDHSENQEADIFNTTISQKDTFDITIEYPDIKTELASTFYSEEAKSGKTEGNASEEVLEVEKSEPVTNAVTNEVSSHICSFCDKGFKNSISLKIHIRSHTRERRHKCKDCDKSFTTQSSLKRHELSHSGLKPYACDMCPAKYSQSSHLVRHRGIHQRQLQMDITKVSEENEASRNTEHVQEYGKGESLVQPVKPSDAKDKRKHCSICDKFVHRLTQHQFVHNKIRPYQCKYCHKGFTQMYRLTQHIRKHTKEKPFVCSHCDKAFTNTADLKIHIRSHTQERPFQCKMCSKAFITSGHLLRHTETHIGLKPFSCDICQAHFAQKAHMIRHKRVHEKLV